MAATLKYLSLTWILLLLMLAACRNKASVKAIDQWADYRKAYGLLAKNPDSAFYYFNRAATSATDKQQIALAYQSMAYIQSAAGDDYGAQESLTLALRSLDAKDPRNRVHLADDYNQLGVTFSNLNEYTQALYYYQRALSYVADSVTKAHLLNNQGNAFKGLKNYDRAIRAYESALRMNGSQDAYARVLTNLTFTRWLQAPGYNASPELLRGLTIRKKLKDAWGENSSFAHLADYYTSTKPDSALGYAQQMLQTASQLRSADDQITALRKLIVLDPRRATFYFKHYQQLEDSVQTARNAARNQFAVIRYNVAQAKAENLALLQANASKEAELIAVIAFASLCSIGGIWWYRKRKQRLQLQAKKEINESKLKLSQKVHDQVANGVYRIMSEVEHNEAINKIQLLDQLDYVYEVSRNIAHDSDEPEEEFSVRIGALLNAFKNTAVRLAITGNEPELWKKVPEETKAQLVLVLQELMVNMNKHSRATQAYIGFGSAQDQLKIRYRDDGVGLNDQKKNGKGLENTVSRITALKGRINFENLPKKGLGIEILLPLKK